MITFIQPYSFDLHIGKTYNEAIEKGEGEIWKPVPGFEGFYSVSNLGNVVSLKRIILRKDGKPHTVKKRKLKQHPDSSGYLNVVLYRGKKRYPRLVHKLVAMAFLEHKPGSRKIIVDHIDNNRLNNNVKNLQITTARHNASKDVKNPTSNYTGVCWDSINKRWIAQAMINGKRYFMGRFKNEIDAANAYKEKLKSHGITF